ncbi:Gfo/Idh/MocA family oxidoreductase [Mesorhizobium sp. C280B]|uniref:Gfo/Idh/MocA family oxidoreductase n=1 Tax=unclassified Mesorhizobium TaxID=325217 RepID=UPI0003CE9F99|nr:Gfo/Idh/MocA family oxidoreductase [Mesorhizobium sp. LSJC280B00]ESW92698.1 myo-inositol 2-dehydrogenase [Mesorhizobium sp. LSJC280B00]
MTVRIAIVGAGIMGADHARIVAEELPGATLQVVCDASPERARTVAQEHGAGDVTTDPVATIRRGDVDAVVIASPDDTHAPLSLAAIEAGKPVLCEKPLSQDANECLHVIEAEVARGRRFVQLGFMRRFDPSYRDLKAILDDGSLGRAIMMHNFHRNVEAPANFTGQMAVTNSAPHEFDVARFVLSTDYKAISVFQPSVVHTTKTGAPVFMVLETDKGQLVNIEINNNAAYGYDVRGELVGEKGSVLLNAPVYTRRNDQLMAYERYAPDWRPRFAEAYRLQDKAFLEFVRSGVFPTVAADAWDGYCAARVAEAGVEALATGARVGIAMDAKPDLYRRSKLP